MDSGSLPAASSPKDMDDAEVLSQRTSPGQGEVQEAVKVAPEGNTSAAENMGEPTPMESADGGHVQFSPNQMSFRRPTRLRSQMSSLL